MYKKTLVLIITVIMMSVSVPNARGIYLYIGEKNQETIYGKVTDKKGKPLRARVELWYRKPGEITEEKGVPTLESQKYVRNLFHQDFTDKNGWYHVTVFPGEYTLRITKGPEYEIKEIPVDIRNIERPMNQGTLNELDGSRRDITLKRMYNLTKFGWYGGDLHHHTFHSDGRNTPRDVVISAMASGLSFCSLNDHNIATPNEIFTEMKTKKFLPIAGVEITPNNTEEDQAPNVRKGWGHHNYFLPEYYGDKIIEATDPDNPVIWDRYIWTNTTQVQNAIDKTHALGGLYMLNHPIFGHDWPDGTQSNWGSIKNYDAIEIWNGECPPHTPNLDSYFRRPKSLFALNTMACQLWFEMLNAGNRVAGWATSDSHDATGLTYGGSGPYDHRGVTGFATTYVKACEGLNYNSIKKGLKNAHVFVTAGSFGPLVLATANYCYIPGKTVRPCTRYHLNKLKDKYEWKNKVDNEIEYDVTDTYHDAMLSNERYVQLSIRILSNRPLKSYDNGVRVIMDGKVIKVFPTYDDVYTMKINTYIPFPKDCKEDTWFIVEVFGDYPSTALTNPFFVDANRDRKWGSKKWQFPANASEWGNPWPKSPDITVPDGPSKPNFDVPPAPVSYENPMNINDYLNPEGTLKDF